MEAARSLLYSTSPFHARAIARSCLPSSPAASPVSYLNEQTTLAASAGSATLLARTSPVSMPLQEQHDAYKPLFRMLKQDTIPQVKYKARTAVKEKREKNPVQPELLFQDQHGHLPTLWDSQGFNMLSAGMDQSELTADNELNNAVDLAKIALSASKEATLSADLELLGANNDDADLVDHKIGEIKTVRSTRHLERKSKRRKTPISNILVPETHNSKRVDVKKKLNGFDQNDPLRLFLWGPETRQLLTLKEESELILHIQIMLKLEQLKSKLESQFRREPTLIEWAEAADLSCRVLKAQLHSGNRSREKLINANLRMVVHIAKHYQGKGLSLQDLMQVGSMGLVKSVEKFNPQVGCRFGTYAYWWIRQTVRKAIFQHSRTIRLPENVYGLLNKIAEAKRFYDQEGVRSPSKEQIAKRVGITVERMDKLLCMARTPISMQQTVWADQETTYEEITADPGVELPDMSVSKQLMRKHVRSLLSILNPRERRIIKLRYGIEGGHQKSLSEIGDVFGLTKERVRQLETRALNKLKECLTTHGLGAYDKCRIGSAGPQNEWYFFSHKDKKYPAGTRTNRATAAGFWKATGRDKAIHLNNSRRIGMRKTLVFYTGRAPHGNKTEWIMHEYRLEDDSTADQVQEDGWVVCRVFKKKNQRGLFQHEIADEDHHDHHQQQQHQHHQEQQQMMKTTMADHLQPKHQEHDMLSSLHHDINNYGSSGTYSNMHHLPQLFSPEANNSNNIMQLAPSLSSFVGPSSTIANMISATYNNNNNTKLGNFISSSSSNVDDLDCSHSLLRLTTGSGSTQRDWSFLDKLLASHSTHVSSASTAQQQQQQLLDQAAAAHQQRCPFQYLMGSDPSDVFK